MKANTIEMSSKPKDKYKSFKDYFNNDVHTEDEGFFSTRHFRGKGEEGIS